MKKKGSGVCLSDSGLFHLPIRRISATPGLAERCEDGRFERLDLSEGTESGCDHRGLFEGRDRRLSVGGGSGTEEELAETGHVRRAELHRGGDQDRTVG